MAALGQSVMLSREDERVTSTHLTPLGALAVSAFASAASSSSSASAAATASASPFSTSGSDDRTRSSASSSSSSSAGAAAAAAVATLSPATVRASQELQYPQLALQIELAAAAPAPAPSALSAVLAPQEVQSPVTARDIDAFARIWTELAVLRFKYFDAQAPTIHTLFVSQLPALFSRLSGALRPVLPLATYNSFLAQRGKQDAFATFLAGGSPDPAKQLSLAGLGRHFEILALLDALAIPSDGCSVHFVDVLTSLCLAAFANDPVISERAVQLLRHQAREARFATVVQDLLAEIRFLKPRHRHVSLAFSVGGDAVVSQHQHQHQQDAAPHQTPGTKKESVSEMTARRDESWLTVDRVNRMSPVEAVGRVLDRIPIDDLTLDTLRAQAQRQFPTLANHRVTVSSADVYRVIKVQRLFRRHLQRAQYARNRAASIAASTIASTAASSTA